MTSPPTSTAFDTIQDLLRAMEVGTRKEDERLTADLLKPHAIARPRTVLRRSLISKLARRIVDGPGPEQFFLGIAQTARPFAIMLREVYGFLEKHAAPTTRRASFIRVSHEGAARSLGFDLTSFPREAIETISRTYTRTEHLRLTSRAIIDAYRSQRSNDNIWNAIAPRLDNNEFYNDFFRALSYAGTFIGVDTRRRLLSGDLGVVLRRVNALTQLLQRPELFAGAATSEGGEIAVGLQSVRWSIPRPNGAELEQEKLNVLHESDGSPRQMDIGYILQSMAAALSIWQRARLTRADKDEWLSTRLRTPYEDISEEQFVLLLETEASAFLGRLEEVVTATTVSIEELDVRVLIDFLTLPFWRDRWFLYELWTICMVLSLAETVCPIRLIGITKRAGGDIEWVLPGGTAKEPIAYIGPRDELACWVQRKTYHPLTCAGLEPDLRLSRRSDHKDIVIIENKDRLKPRRTEVDEIIERYVTGTQAKAVLLLNYESFTSPTHSLPSKRADCTLYVESHFRPGGVSERCETALRDILKHELGIAGTLAGADNAASKHFSRVTVTLTWEAAAQDLDVHAWTDDGQRTHHIYFDDLGQLDCTPYVRLAGDCRSGPGHEELVIEKVLGERVEVAVHNYGDKLNGAGQQIQVTVDQRGRGTTVLSLKDLRQGQWWRLFSITAEGGVILTNTVGDCPGGTERAAE